MRLPGRGCPCRHAPRQGVLMGPASIDPAFENCGRRGMELELVPAAVGRHDIVDLPSLIVEFDLPHWRKP